MNRPTPLNNALVAIAICIVVTIAAALGDWMMGDITRAELLLAVVVYGGIAPLMLYKLADRSDVTRYVFLVFIALNYLNWLRGLSPFPPFLNIAFIVQIPIIALSVYWLFLAPEVAEWYGGTADVKAEDDSPVKRGNPER